VASDDQRCHQGMGRDALLTSGVSAPIPAQKSLNPSAVLVERTTGEGNGPDLAKCSATIALNGYTVEEPTTVISPRAPPSEGVAAMLTIARKSTRAGQRWSDVSTRIEEYCENCDRHYGPFIHSPRVSSSDAY
jgi:hypothetical protein